MIIFIDSYNRNLYIDYINQYFELRKRIFCDQLGWVKPNPDGTETDDLDKANNLYILYVNPRTDILVGGVRLTPSLGCTLMHTAWKDLLPEPNDFRSPSIWEVTRFCVDEDQDTGRSNNFANPVFIRLMLAILQFSQKNGITSLVAVCETKLVRVFKAFGFGPEVISSKTDENGCNISLLVWETNEALEQSVAWARPFLRKAKPAEGSTTKASNSSLLGDPV